MFDAQVLIWWGAQHNPHLFQLLKDLLWGGGIGHSALKLTLPATPKIEVLIHRYCMNNGKMLIPHYQKSIIIPKKVFDANTNQERWETCQTQAFVVYFSWWPNRLGHEHTDRLLKCLETEVEYEAKWENYLEVPRRVQPRGFIHHWLGETLSHFIFGKPKMIANPVHRIIHPHPQSAYWLEKLSKLEAKYSKVQEALSRLWDEILSHIMELRYLESCMQNAKQMHSWQRVLFDIHEAELYIGKLEKKLAIYGSDIQAKSDKIKILEAKEAKLEKEYKMLDAWFHTEFATVGISPDETISLPLSNIDDQIEGLDFEEMLKTMNAIALQSEFEILMNNCSSAVNHVLKSGLTESIFKSLSCANLLQTRELQPPLFDTTSTLSEFSSKLAQAFRSYQFQRLTEQLQRQAQQPSGTASTHPQALRFTRSKEVTMDKQPDPCVQPQKKHHL